MISLRTILRGTLMHFLPALTDRETQHLLEESRSDFSGFERVAPPEYAEVRKDK